MNELDNMETERFSELKQVEEEPKKGGRRGFGYSEIEKEEQSEEEYLEEEEQSEEEYLEEEEQSEEEYSEEEEQSEEYLEEEEQSEEEYLEEEEQSEEEDLEEEEQSEEVKGGKRGFRERPRYGQKGFRGRPRYGQRGYGGRRYPTRECEKKKMEKVEQLNKLVDNEMKIIDNSMNVLKEWSNKNTFNVIFDSKIDGDGSNNVIKNRVMNRSNLYFITFDNQNNVFGGYLSKEIYESNSDIGDYGAFVFSLIRSGKVKNAQYSIQRNWSGNAFYLYDDNQNNFLYQFGNDIYVKPIGGASSCNCYNYNYNNERNPFISTAYFKAKRIIVIEMN